MAEQGEERKVTSEQMARKFIFGENVQLPGEGEPTPEDEPKPEDPKPEETPPGEEPKPEETPPGEEPKPDGEPPKEEPKPEETPPEPIDLSTVPDDKVLELINNKFSSNFDSIDKAIEFFGKETQARGSREVIEKLTEKLKETSNVLAHFPSENAYKVAQLAKEKFPGKDALLSRIVGADLSQLSDFDAIRVAHELKRPPNSRVDGLVFQLAKMGLRDLDVADFSDWDENDKQLVYGLAEEARMELAEVGKDIEIPKAEGGVDEFVSELQRGVAEAEETQKQQIEAIKPIAESLINSTKIIKPVEGDDFEYEIALDSEAKGTLLDYLTYEALEGKYDLKSDADLKRLQGMLHAEIMATEYKKAFTAYGKYREDKAWQAAQQKYENAEPLRDDKPPADPGEKKFTAEDAAQRILRGGR